MSNLALKTWTEKLNIGIDILVFKRVLLAQKEVQLENKTDIKVISFYFDFLVCF